MKKLLCVRMEQASSPALPTHFTAHGGGSLQARFRGSVAALVLAHFPAVIGTV